MKCLKCNNEQESGRFCGVCGTPMQAGETVISSYNEAAVAMEETVAPTPVQTNDGIDKVKKVSGQYGSYALNLLKKPALALQFNESQFINGLITVAIYLLAFSLSIYFLANELFKSIMGGFGGFFEEPAVPQSLPFFEISSTVFFYGLLFVAGAAASILAAVKLMKGTASVKQSIAQFGGLLVPFAALNLIAIVGGLTGSISFTLILLGTSLVFSVFLLPALQVLEKAIRSQHVEHKVYWSLGASAFSMFIAYIIVRTVVLDYVEKLEAMFNMF